MQTTQAKEIPTVRGLIVSIHDVSPLTRDATQTMLADLSALGVERTSLLVIPDHHRRGRILDDAGFCEWARNCVATGHEAVLHGYFHWRERKAGDGAMKRLVTESYTAGEGEFHDLSEDEAAALLERGLADFREAGLHPSGFIAPAWLLGKDAARAVERLGFDYTTRIDRVEDLVSDRWYASQSLVYSVRAAWRRIVSLGWNEFLLRKLGDRALVRVGLHPPDWKYPAIRRHALDCIRRALAGREAMTYDGWLRRQRAASDS